MKRTFIAGIIFLFSYGASAQLKTYRVGIFSPLYLDSAFNGNAYKYGKSFPRYTQQGLDFVQGAMIAMDSMPLPNSNIQASIFDSRSAYQDISWLISTHKLDSLDLLIGATKDVDFLQLAAFAKQKNIPFISAVYPNDGGVTANPFLVIVNSTLRAHCESLYSYILQEHGTDKIFLVRKKGTQEDKIAEYFRAINEANGKPLLNIQTVNFDDDDISAFVTKADSSRKNIIIGGSLNEDFALGLVKEVYPLKKKYSIEMIGMPNWDNFRELRKSAYKDLPIIYTSSFTNPKTDVYTRRIRSYYAKKYKGNPSDMSYKGFETVYIFTRLLSRYPDDFMSHLNEYAYKVFSEYNFKPVYINKTSSVPDYFENRHLYFMKILNGSVMKVWQ